MKYAKGLFLACTSPQEIEKIQRDLDYLVNVIEKEPNILQLLSCEELSVEVRVNTIEKLLQADLTPLLKNFLSLILKKRKVKYLKSIGLEYRKLLTAYSKSLDVNVQSFEPLSETVRQELLLKLQYKFKKKIHLIETINPELITGFIVLIGNKMIDLSILGQLKKLKTLILKR